MDLIRQECSEEEIGVPTVDDQETEIVAALRRIVRAIDLRSRELVETSGLTGPQLLVLREASRLSGAPISALARAISLSQPTVSGIIDRLEKRGLVRRARGTGDRRTVFVTVTTEGGRALRSAPSMLQDRFRSELARLEEWEQTQLLATLQRVASMMGAEEIDAAPMLAPGPIDATGNPAIPAEADHVSTPLDSKDPTHIGDASDGSNEQSG
jgi:DNA-binding MarR family transcriptional regulator